MDIDLLSNENIELSKFEIEDEKDVFQAMNDPQNQKYLLTIPIPYTLEDASKFVEKAIYTYQNFETSEFIRFAIRDESNKELLGGIEIRKNHYLDSIGVWSMPSKRGKGYIKQAVKLVTNWAIKNNYCFGNEIYWGCQKSNIASQKIAKACNFEYGGTICSTDSKSAAKNSDGSPLLNRDGNPVVYNWYLLK